MLITIKKVGTLAFTYYSIFIYDYILKLIVPLCSLKISLQICVIEFVYMS
jgi:hypothetical protein